MEELLFEHVAEGRYHPSIITESLRPIIDEILETATREDWQAVAAQLVGEAREAIGPVDAPDPPPRRRCFPPFWGGAARTITRCLCSSKRFDGGSTSSLKTSI